MVVEFRPVAIADDPVHQFQLGLDEDKTELVQFVKSKRKLPSRSVIVKAWNGLGLSIFPAWSDAERLCWRCGDPPSVCGRANLDRAHLVPHALGGTDDPTNLVLLCEDCHHWGPNFIDRRFMIDHVEQLTKLRQIDDGVRKASTHVLQVRQMEWAWMILGGDVDSEKTTWRKIGNRFAELYKTKTVHHFARNGDLFADRMATAVAIFQTIIDELPDD